MSNTSTPSQTVVSSMPECYFCKMMENISVYATVYGQSDQDGWANMCESCFTDRGVAIGLGRGQRLVLAS